LLVQKIELIEGQQNSRLVYCIRRAIL